MYTLSPTPTIPSYYENTASYVSRDPGLHLDFEVEKKPVSYIKTKILTIFLHFC